MDNVLPQDFSTEGTTPVVSAPAQSDPAPTPVILLPASPSDVNVVKKGSGGPKIKWGKGAKAMLAGSILALVLLVGGVFTATQLTKKPTNSPTKAWNGYGANYNVLQKYKNLPRTSESRFLQNQSAPVVDHYNKLVDSSNNLLTREVQYFHETDIPLNGVAFLTYVPHIGRTFVFSKIDGMPLPLNNIARLWITKDGSSYRPVGVVEYVKENNQITAYSIFSSEDDLRTYKDLVISYDSSMDVKVPGEIAITVKF